MSLDMPSNRNHYWGREHTVPVGLVGCLLLCAAPSYLEYCECIKTLPDRQLISENQRNNLQTAVFSNDDIQLTALLSLTAKMVFE